MKAITLQAKYDQKLEEFYIKVTVSKSEAPKFHPTYLWVRRITSAPYECHVLLRENGEGSSSDQNYQQYIGYNEGNGNPHRVKLRLIGVKDDGTTRDLDTAEIQVEYGTGGGPFLFEGIKQ